MPIYTCHYQYKCEVQVRDATMTNGKIINTNRAYPLSISLNLLSMFSKLINTTDNHPLLPLQPKGNKSNQGIKGKVISKVPSLRYQ